MQLRYFLEVARDGHVTRAARKLSISQPSLTRSVKRLEAELGTTLLAHRGRGVELTEAGAAVAAELSELMPRIDMLAELARTAEDVGNSTIHICVTAATALVVDAMAEWEMAHEGAAFQMSQDLDVELVIVSEPEGGRVTAVFRGDTYLSELTLLRQQSAEVIRRTTEGIRVPIEAVRLRERTVTDDDGGETLVRETGVYCIVGMEARFKPVEVLYSDENFALVRSTLDTADTTTGLEEIRLRAGDEVIITARDLYDGKTMS